MMKEGHSQEKIRTDPTIQQPELVIQEPGGLGPATESQSQQPKELKPKRQGKTSGRVAASASKLVADFIELIQEHPDRAYNKVFTDYDIGEIKTRREWWGLNDFECSVYNKLEGIYGAGEQHLLAKEVTGLYKKEGINDNVRLRCVSVLGHFANTYRFALNKNFKDLREDSANVFIDAFNRGLIDDRVGSLFKHMDPEGAKALIELVEREQDKPGERAMKAGRGIALGILGRWMDYEGVPEVLFRFANHPDDTLKGWAASGMGWFFRGKGVLKWLKALTAPDKKDQRGVDVSPLSKAIDILLDLSHSKNKEVRANAVASLSTICDVRAFRRFIEIINTKEYYQEETHTAGHQPLEFASTGLKRLGDKRALEPLLEMVKKEKRYYKPVMDSSWDSGSTHCSDGVDAIGGIIEGIDNKELDEFLKKVDDDEILRGIIANIQPDRAADYVNWMNEENAEKFLRENLEGKGKWLGREGIYVKTVLTQLNYIDPDKAQRLWSKIFGEEFRKETWSRVGGGGPGLYEHAQTEEQRVSRAFTRMRVASGIDLTDESTLFEIRDGFKTGLYSATRLVDAVQLDRDYRTLMRDRARRVIGVEANANEDEIKKAYRKLSRECHPDIAKNKEEAEEKFKEINEAYRILVDDRDMWIS